VEDLSYEEIGKVLDCPAGTVAARLNRAHKMLAGKLARLRR
jgi:DNA-directed RNA polymerase specialized sigma24 family protein